MRAIEGVKKLLVQDLDTPDVARLAGLLERLVAIDTQNPPGREVEAAALLAAELEAIGFATEVRPVGGGHASSRSPIR